jgi:phosphoribosylanthranilate isomerase
LAQQASIYDDALGLLVDTYKPGIPGGSGESFDWHRLPQSLSKPLILAGGLTPDNVAEAIKQVAPYAVDVSGGVEASKGIKDNAKMLDFMKAVDLSRLPS